MGSGNVDRCSMFEKKKKILLILRNKIHIISSGTGTTVKKEKKIVGSYSVINELSFII